MLTLGSKEWCKNSCFVIQEMVSQYGNGARFGFKKQGLRDANGGHII